MITNGQSRELDAIIPGVSEAYNTLISSDGGYIETSAGSFYNHTLFGRDAGATAKFVTDFDHEVARQTILALAKLQGVEYDRRTQEELGRIHHEWRNFKLWQGSLAERIMLWPWKYIWGGNSRLLLTYFAADTTAGYIRLVHKYATHIDAGILSVKITDKSGTSITIAETVERAAQWIAAQVHGDLFMTKRSNVFSLPFQTYQDSITAYSRTDGSLAKYQDFIGYVEIQAFAADALYDACHMLDDNVHRHEWQQAKATLECGLYQTYWSEAEKFFAICIDKKGPTDRLGVSAGWTLNTSSWEDLPDQERADKLSSIVRRLFSNEFLTSAGLRTRAVSQPPIMPDLIEYHGALTVWPMFTFMVIEGLRRHHLYQLAEQLENRLINTLNISGHFDEFFIVQRDGSLNLPSDDRKAKKAQAQMPPEQNIAFTVVPALTMAQRIIHPPEKLPQETWQAELEKEILNQIPIVERLSPDVAKQMAAGVPKVRIARSWANLRTTGYFVKESLKR